MENGSASSHEHEDPMRMTEISRSENVKSKPEYRKNKLPPANWFLYERKENQTMWRPRKPRSWFWRHVSQEINGQHSARRCQLRANISRLARMQLIVTFCSKLNYELTFLCHNFIRESSQLKDAICSFFSSLYHAIYVIQPSRARFLL